MDESTLWKHLKPELARHGKFQKISDRFTPGIPDVLGSSAGRAYAFELKQFKGVNQLSVRFRPGQLDWLHDWGAASATGLILAVHRTTVFTFTHLCGEELEEGVTRTRAEELAILVFTKARRTSWQNFVSVLVA